MQACDGVAERTQSILQNRFNSGPVVRPLLLRRGRGSKIRVRVTGSTIANYQKSLLSLSDT